jgi:transcription antitermination factor NusG
MEHRWGMPQNFGRKPRWYAVRTAPRHEKRVRDHIDGRNIECFLPLYQTVHRWKNGCKTRLELPLFPNYLFVEIDLADRVRVLEIPGVLSLVGTGPSLWPLPEGEVEALRAGLHLRNPEPHAYLTAGQKVRIKVGALAGLTGFVLRTNDRLRVVLAVEMLMQGVAVEVHLDDIEAFSEPSSLSR